MKVVIVTGESPHHQHLCAHIARDHQVVGIFHPLRIESRIKDLSRLFGRVRKHGAGWTALNAVGQFQRRGLERRWQTEIDPAIADSLRSSALEYQRIAPAIVHRIRDFGSAETRQLLVRLKPEVVICLGGPVYPRGFIEACPLVLNYHSGFSPVYNGTSTIWFAFANGHPQFCAGTLMTLSPVVDGGDILGHFLPAVSPEDNPQSLFLKTALGAVEMYRRVLRDFSERGMAYPRLPQPPPLFYYRAIDWTMMHVANVKRHVRQKRCAAFLRAEKAVEYWPLAGAAAAGQALQGTMQTLMWSGA